MDSDHRWVFVASGIFACVLSGLCVILSYWRIRQIKAAESRLAQKMNESRREAFERLVLNLHQALPDSATVEEARALINRALDNISPKDRRRILAALSQPSLTGRLEYMRKIMSQAEEVARSRTPAHV